MATPRHRLVDADSPLHYHIVSRCVRRAWLCGIDPYSGTNCDHRKQWIEDRLAHLAKFFAIAVDGYAVMSNHFHLVVYYDPKESSRWSDEEVAYRWYEAFPPKHNGEIAEEMKPLMRSALLEQPKMLASKRAQLGSLSAFMQHLKQPIGYRANREDGTEGHFFEKRFYSGALLDEAALLTSMAYVDLNPVRAKIARSIDECINTSIETRLSDLRHTPEALERAIGPVISGLNYQKPAPGMSLGQYIQQLESLTTVLRSKRKRTQPMHKTQETWMNRLAVMSKRQRAFGMKDSLITWLAKRQMRVLEHALPVN